MSNTVLQLLETDHSIDALNAALAARRIAADAVVAIHEKPADPLRVDGGNAAKYPVIYRA